MFADIIAGIILLYLIILSIWLFIQTYLSYKYRKQINKLSIEERFEELDETIRLRKKSLQLAIVPQILLHLLFPTDYHTFYQNEVSHLVIAESLTQLDFSKLMELYKESNTDNLNYLFLDFEEKERLDLIIDGFKAYLVEFFSKVENRYFVYAKHNQYTCAARLNKTESGKYIVEGLETQVDERKKGYATKLLKEMTLYFLKTYPKETLFSPHITNEYSIAAHKNAGFIEDEKHHSDGSISLMIHQ